MTEASLAAAPALRPYQLSDNLAASAGPVFLTGTQALVRLLLMQKAQDERQGLKTAGFVSGYRGSPLGMVDQQLWKAKKFLDKADVNFLPAINEDLAATACLGVQRVALDPKRTVDGVFAMWYGKGPGVDRSGDALKHGNVYGTAKQGGVLVVCGDDHGCVSSSTPHQSDLALQAWSMPLVHPGNVAEYLEFGLYGWALSRFSGAWVGFKAISEVVESGMTVDLDAVPMDFELPVDHTPPTHLHIRSVDLPSLELESRLAHKIDAVLAFAKVNSIDKHIVVSPRASLGIVTVGKAHYDFMEVLRRLDLDPNALAAAGVRVYKVGLVYPLEPTRIREFAQGLTDMLVIEEKAPVVERQIKELLYHLPDAQRPRVVGKSDEHGAAVLSALGELRPSRIMPTVADWLARLNPALDRRHLVVDFLTPCLLSNSADAVRRQPYFCSGCPHNTSTKLPEGSRALAGIGCHFMASWMERGTSGLIQMGAEGVDWAAHSRFTTEKHVFQNLGDGTYYHSGYLAIRQAIAAKANITYKILYNDAVAMTGGQPVDGQTSVPQIARQVEAEGVKRLVVVSDDIDKYEGHHGLFPAGTTFHDRAELDAVQRELREIAGVTVLIYDQTCAAEKRRRRKKGEFPDPDKRIFINESVCEGCGDCGQASNCLSVVPVETDFGRKRVIEQSSCNKDFSCAKGFCPSFVTVEGGTLKKSKAGVSKNGADDGWGELPAPVLPGVEHPYNILINGIGGTGVITVGALMGMAAHLEGKGASVLDMTGMSQKNGSVTSHVKIAATPQRLRAQRIATGEADLILGCDILTTGAADAVSKMRPGRTLAIVNLHEQPTGTFAQQRDWEFPSGDVRALILEAVGGESGVDFVDATKLATALMGDSIATNLFLMGYAWQKGRIPLSEAALLRAIELNGVAVASNKMSFLWGRRAAVDFKRVEKQAIPAQTVVIQMPQSLDSVIKKRVEHLTGYQDAAYAAVYEDLVKRVREAESAKGLGNKLAMAVAKNYAKLMAYKDEYEVARLYTDGRFVEQLKTQFEGDFSLSFNLAPPLLAKKDAKGHMVKAKYGSWMFGAFKMLARLKGLRGGAFDVFGYTAERKMERALVGEYREMVEALLARLDASNHAEAVELAALPDQIRGFGHVKEQAVAEYRARKAELLSGNVKRRAA